MSWFAGLFRRRRYQDLAVSIEEHIAEKSDELVESGMPREEAERAARRAFGNRTVITERSREAWHWPRLESLVADVRLVFRRLLQGAWICGDGAADAGDRDWREHGGVSRWLIRCC